MNRSKVNDPRFWKRWSSAGACRLPGERFLITVKRTWEVHDIKNERTLSLEPGVYLAERRPNPRYTLVNWLVILDHTPFSDRAIGMAEGAWRQWKNGQLNRRGEPTDWKEFEIVIKPLTPRNGASHGARTKPSTRAQRRAARRHRSLRAA
jgi:hypothetical protein